MATSNPHDEDDRPQSAWHNDFWRKYDTLSSLIVNRPDGYPPQQLVPAPKATAGIRKTEKLLSHVVSRIDPKQDSVGERWSKDVAYVSDLSLNGDQGYLSLSDLASWEAEKTTVERSKPGRAAGSEIVYVDGYLPPAAADRLYNQLEKVVHHIGWADSVTIQDYRAGEDEVATHK
jgi:hypothetical protein